MIITSKTNHAAVIGHPIGHSLSPALHNSIYRKLGLDIVYLAFDVAKCDLKEAINGLRALGFVGFNVTIPYKEKIMGLLDELDPTALAIGAVNTVKIENGKLIGYNTDGLGFLSSLRMHNIECKDRSILILGAGGAARAIGISLVKENPREILILNRSKDRGQILVKDINKYADGNISYFVERAPIKVDIIINTTPLGMWPNVTENPLRNYVFQPDTIVCDIVYNPPTTLLLKRAKNSGCMTVDGIGMLVGQGIEAIEIWTGEKVDNSIVKQVIHELLDVLAQ